MSATAFQRRRREEAKKFKEQLTKAIKETEEKAEKKEAPKKQNTRKKE